ncbi:SGNH/GDSL hydrolase family protein [Undibacterium sp. LX40W]|uniref:SGNH/GDSL hydrolase family protein n=1 Tax=Undibacterium nitidum TaxID=2762298 RepID=A0A923HMJ2_9BURK|nr:MULTISPECIES: SGNH/GDSL hydrolase family protein [Undibacterium]MBC3880536.1 SGNH/GDSL hydrolase family protein [Undibacterium nitidum]MBC3890728.1 SGNH/GDSL hydrolase family protein [Undibacterium sp. LX40W]
MRHLKLSLTFVAAAALVACGGGTSSSSKDPAPKITFSSQVTFGDSLSDVGTYKVGTVAALGGGKYTVNSATAKNWTEIVASNLGLPAPCAAQTGLEGLAAQGFSVPVKVNAGCTGYAQGGARVTNPVGPGNKLLGGANAILGQTTVPVVTQIQNYLAANGGKFSGTEIVFVSGGPNDVFIQTGALSSAATAAATAAITAAVPGQIQKDIAAGVCKPTDAQASNCIAGAVATLTPTVGAAAGAAYASANAQTYVDAIGTAGTELAGYVKNLVLAKGAKYVVVVNMPDMSKTPAALSQSKDSQTLLNGMSVTFNARLVEGLAGIDNVLLVDLYTRFRDHSANPSSYGISNITTPACDLSAAKNPLGSSLVCTANNLIPGDTSRYYFADTVHPTPFGNQLFAEYITSEITKRGWK